MFDTFNPTWGAIARFIGYMLTIMIVAITGYMSARSILEQKTLDHIERCQFIVDKYEQDKNKKLKMTKNDKYLIKKGEEYGG